MHADLSWKTTPEKHVECQNHRCQVHIHSTKPVSTASMRKSERDGQKVVLSFDACIFSINFSNGTYFDVHEFVFLWFACAILLFAMTSHPFHPYHISYIELKDGRRDNMTGTT